MKKINVDKVVDITKTVAVITGHEEIAGIIKVGQGIIDLTKDDDKMESAKDLVKDIVSIDKVKNTEWGTKIDTAVTVISISETIKEVLAKSHQWNQIQNCKTHP